MTVHERSVQYGSNISRNCGSYVPVPIQSRPYFAHSLNIFDRNDENAQWVASKYLLIWCRWAINLLKTTYKSQYSLKKLIDELKTHKSESSSTKSFVWSQTYTQFTQISNFELDHYADFLFTVFTASAHFGSFFLYSFYLHFFIKTSSTRFIVFFHRYRRISSSFW